MTITLLEKRPDGIEVYRLANECLEAKVATYGGCLMELKAKDRDGVPRDVILGYDTLEGFMENDGYLSLLVGRVANRIAGASFTLNGARYELEKNDGANTLHGGSRGICFRNLTASVTKEGLALSCVIPDMEDGFPGTLSFTAVYALEGDRFVIRYRASSNKDTIINLTHHAYFNLSGTGAPVTDHLMTLRASAFCPISKEVLATGEHRDVTGTPFDYRRETRIGDLIGQACEQLSLAGGGYDHSFVFDAERDQVTLFHPGTGLELTVSTDLPQVQIYSSNMLSERPGKGYTMGRHSGICFETQFEPNSINSESPSPTVLRAGEVFESVTSFRLRVRL